MLMRFGFSNHLSVRNYQSLSFVASSLKGATEGLIEIDGIREKFLPSALIYGANASGKSNILDGLRTMRMLILHSFNKGSPTGSVPRSPFALDPACASEPSRFDVDFLISGTRYHYGFTCSSDVFLEEWLYAFPNGNRQVWFERSPNSETYFGKNLKGRNRSIEGLNRSNSLFLSAAAQNAHQQLTEIYRYFQDKFAFDLSASVDVADIRTSLEKRIDNKIIDFLKHADVGIGAARIENIEMTPERLNFSQDFLSLMKKHIPDAPEFPIDDIPKNLRFGHSGVKDDIIYLDLELESRGTLRLYKILGPILTAIDEGKIVIIDELDASLHSLLAMKVVELFSSPNLNTGNAQLLTTTHDTNLLCLPSLRRDQIWFSEKHKEGSTDIFPLTDIKTRKDDNLEKFYLEGRFGGVPFLGGLEKLIKLEFANKVEIERGADGE